MLDTHANLAISTVATPPANDTDTELVVNAGHGTRFPAADGAGTDEFNCTIWPADASPNPTNAEIVRVTEVATDTFTIAREQEGTTARTVIAGDRIALTITTKSITDIEERVFNVRDFGATGDNSTNDTTAIQAAIDAGMAANSWESDGYQTVIYFPPGRYKHDGLFIEDTVDRQALITLRGEGRRVTKLVCRNDDDINLTIQTVSGNIRDITVSDLTLSGGDTALYADEMAYCTFRNITFEGAETVAVNLQSGSVANTFLDCWWLQNQGESFKIQSSASASIVGGIFGEDSGHIQTSGILTMSGVFITQIATKNPGSDADLTAMGDCTFYVTGNGNLSISGSYISTDGNCVNSNYGDSVTMSGNRIHVTGSGTFFMVRGSGGSEVHAVISGNTISFADGCQLYDKISGHDPLRRSVISNNAFYLTGSLFDTTFDDGLTDPQNQNQIMGNTIREGENPA